MEIIKTISQISPLSQESQDALESIIVDQEFSKGHHLLNIGYIDRDFHYVVTGSGRVYYLKDGKDITDYIAMDGDFLGGVESLFTRQPSQKGIELTEDSRIQSFNYGKFEELCSRLHDLESAGRKIAIFAFLECQQRIESIRFLSASERYNELVRKYPGISNRIPLKHLASYLGTSQVSLSRIRKGIQ